MAIDAPPEDQAANELDFVRQWLEAIELSGENGEEKDWFAAADRACEAYRGGTPKSGTASNLNTFNIFHSNVETLVPSLYNSTPAPDVRRRFNDSDPIAKEVSEIFERAISFQIDAYDFDQTMLASVRDMTIVSRGLARVRYEPSFDSYGLVEYEKTTCEYSPWRSFRRGPARIWEDVPWIAFETYLSYSEVGKLVKDEKDKDAILKEMRFSYSAEPKKNAEQQGESLSKLAARARVWEIWDKDNRKVHFISPDYASRRLTTMDDPLGLSAFFPIPRPLSAIIAPDSLVPVTLLQIYETLLDELNVVQRRIMRLTQQLRVRGWYSGLQSEDIKLGSEADDGEMLPLSGAENFVTTGTGLDKAIFFWPLDTITKALEQLVAQREQIKQTIYEVTGISDIIRGASDARETATAQQIKTQWGSLRIQRMQAEVARFARDLFRIKCEIMAKKFSFETFETMTGLKYPSSQEKQQAQQQLAMMQQAQQPPPKELQELISKPTREEVEGLLRNEAVRGFRVDIESDSTIRGDVQRNQEQAALFIQGIGQYTSSVGPLVQEGAMPADVAIEILAAFCRTFRLGKQAEDAIDKWADQAKSAQGQQKPSPEEIKAQAEQQKHTMELEAKREEHKMKQETMQFEMALKREEIQLKRQELDMKREELGLEIQAQQQEAALRQEEMHQEAEINQQQRRLDVQTMQQKHALNIDGMNEKARIQSQQAKQQAKAKKVA